MADRVAALSKILNSKFKKSTSNGGRSGKVGRISTGSILMDQVLGGGLPVGRTTMFYGEKSGGKTTSALRAMGIAQGLCRNCLRPAKNIVAVPPDSGKEEYDRWHAKGECDCYAAGIAKPKPPAIDAGETPKAHISRVAEWRKGLKENSYDEMICAFVDSEDTFDPTWAECLGVDTRRMLLSIVSSGEEGVDIGMAIIESAQVDLLIVDSIANFIPRTEYEESAEKWQQGLQARIVNKGMRKFTAANASAFIRSDRRTTTVLINQLRTKIGVSFGDPNVKPSGKGQDFAAVEELKFLNSKTEVESEQYGLKADVLVRGQSELIRFKSTKDKASGMKGAVGQYRQCVRSNDVWKKGDVMDDVELFKLAMKYIIDPDSKEYNIGDREFRTQAELKNAILHDNEFRRILHQTILEEILR